MKKWLLMITFMIFSLSAEVKALSVQDDFVGKFAQKSFWANILKAASTGDDIVIEKISQDALLHRQALAEGQDPQPVFEAKVWISEAFIQKTFSKSYGWQEDFDASGLNINVGADIFSLNLAGFFLSHKDMKARQKSISGEIEDMRIGAYKSFYSEQAFIHTVFSFGRHSFKVEKDSYIDYFDSYAVRFGVDSDFNPHNRINPFIGMRAVFSFNDDINAYYEDIGTVEIPGDMQSRFEGLGGIKARYLNDFWTLSLKAYALSVLKGAKTHYGSVEGNHEDAISAGAEVGIERKIGSRFVLFANAEAQQGALTSGYRVNAGFSFTIMPSREIKVLSDIEDIKVPNYLSLNKADGAASEKISQVRIVNEIRLNGWIVEKPALKTNPDNKISTAP